MTSTIGVKKIQYPNGTDILTLDSSGTLAIGGSITSNITTTGTVNTPSINGGQIGGRRNIIINGAMQVAQRSTSETGLGGGADVGYKVLDRFRLQKGGSPNARYTMTQDSNTPSGFANSMKLEVTTATSSFAAADHQYIDQFIEAQNLQQLAYGTSSAETITLSFYVKCSTAQTFGLDLDNEDNDRYFNTTYAVSSPNTWERKIITFPADTVSGFNNDNGRGLRVRWTLIAGANYTGGSVSTAWSGTQNYATNHENTWVGSTGQTWQLTGVQLELGSQATAFEHRSFDEEQALCERYFQKWTHNGAGGGNITNGMITNTRFYGVLQFKKDMRAIPTITTTSSGFNVTSSAHTVGSLSIDETHNTTIHACRLRTGTNGSFSNGQAAILRFDSGSINIDAEL